ncbi:MAG: hypothetical protein HRF45_05465 [Fimbriimonadia bacterium]
MANSRTSFEPLRGVTDVRVRTGLCHLRLEGLGREDLMPRRLHALKCLRDAGVKIDFLKLTADGFACVVVEEDSDKAIQALALVGGHVAESHGRALLSVHCVNIRDQVGIVAKIVEAVTAAGARIEQVGDSHDRILLVVEQEAGRKAANALQAAFQLGAFDAN